MGIESMDLLGQYGLNKRKGQISRFGYDGLNRRISSIFDDGSKTEYVYDGAGRLTNITDTVTGTIAFAYDNLDRLISEMTPQGIVAYTYDVIGRRTAITANGLPPVTYQYDTASRLTQVAQGTQSIGLAYDATGRRTSLTYPNSMSTFYTYDNASRLLSIEHLNSTTQQLIEGLTYTYDAAGNRISFTRSGPQAALPQAVQAAYDAANEMLTRNSELGTQNLSYDANGNLTSQTDANGTTTYTWDARNRLTGINTTVIASNSEAISASFTYDALGRRTSKTINGVTTQYIYDRHNIVAEIQNGVIEAAYLRGLRIDEAFVRQTSSNTDALGSVMGLTDQTGAMQTTYSYDPFGNTAITGTSANPFQYTGRENDGTGLYYYRARYYSPRLQRFISEDPIRLLGGINFYGYVRNNPLKFKDPLGLEHDDDTLWPWVPDIHEPDYTPEEAQEFYFTISM